MTVRIEIDLNVRVCGNKTFAGFEDVQPGTVTYARASHADGPVSVGDAVHVIEPFDGIIGDAIVVGQRVIAFERESGVTGDAVVTEVDPEKRLIYLAVDWHSFRDDEPEDECDGGDHLAETQDWTTRTYTLAQTPDTALPRFPEDD